jgi:hypothetical protein
MPLLKRFVAAIVLLSRLAAELPAAEWTIDRTKTGLAVKQDGQLVTDYLTSSGAKPILWPLIAPGGQQLTRAYPMLDVASEEHDHPHQRSCWFTHGKVNGIDFWSEQTEHGTIVHRDFVETADGDRALIVTRNDWLAPGGVKQCEDRRRLVFREDSGRRLIDFEITIKASDGPVVFGDTKEGCFGVRVASTIRVDSKRGGRIVNSNGDVDAAAWGKPASWVDYQGPVEGQVVGIAILNHPSSFRFPGYWHVRTYGLFAANPFGKNDFTSGGGDGSYTLPAGESLALSYRMVLHEGDERAGRIADAFAAYAKEKIGE